MKNTVYKIHFEFSVREEANYLHDLSGGKASSCKTLYIQAPEIETAYKIVKAMPSVEMIRYPYNGPSSYRIYDIVVKSVEEIGELYN